MKKEIIIVTISLGNDGAEDSAEKAPDVQEKNIQEQPTDEPKRSLTNRLSFGLLDKAEKPQAAE